MKLEYAKARASDAKEKMANDLFIAKEDIKSGASRLSAKIHERTSTWKETIAQKEIGKKFSALFTRK